MVGAFEECGVCGWRWWGLWKVDPGVWETRAERAAVGPFRWGVLWGIPNECGKSLGRRGDCACSH